jgi:nucleoside-diphosphate-sugar epimerase
MRILVTGASGHIGRYVVRELVQAGHQVTGVDVAFARSPGVRSLLVDVTDAGQVYQVLVESQAEAVIHLGSWAGRVLVPASRTFGDNVRGTFNVFQACADLGVRRVIWGSSNHVYGVIKAPPLYVPIDEAHPLRPADAYELSKVVGEQAAEYFVAQHGLEILSFRLMGVRVPSRLGAEIERIAQAPGERIHLLWTRTDARDAATACRLAVEAKEIETGPYNITGRQVVLEEDSATLVRRYFGDEIEIRSSLVGRMSPLSCKRAEETFGYRPRYDWSVSQRYPEEDEPCEGQM